MNAIIKSEARVPFRDLEIPDLSKWNNLGLYAQGTTDNVVASFLAGGMAYAGLGVSAASTTAGNVLVNVAPGLFFRAGIGYALRDMAELDLSRFVAQVPDAAKTLSVLIVIDGQEADTNGDEVFLDENREPSDPTLNWPTTDLAAPTMTVRSIVPSSVGGVADVQPQDGAYNTAILLPVARVIIGINGILSVEQITFGQITRLDQMAAIVTALQAQSTDQAAKIAALQAALAGVMATEAAQFAAILAELALLKGLINALQTQAQTAASGAPAGAATYSDVDFFLDLTKSSPGLAGYSCKIDNGLTFAPANINDIEFSAFPFPNPIGANAQGLPGATLRGTKIVPNFTETPVTPFFPPNSRRILVGLGPLPAAGQQRGFGVQRTRFGASYGAASTSEVRKVTDPTTILGLTTPYQASWGPWASGATEIVRNKSYWRDLTGRDFWTNVIASPLFPSGLKGVCMIVQRRNTKMLNRLAAAIMAGTGDPNIRLLIMRVDAAGQPDWTQILADVTSSVDNIHPGDVTSVLEFPMPYPIEQRNDQSYAYVFITAGSHQIYLATGKTFPGNVLVYQNGSWIPYVSDVNLAIYCYDAEFPSIESAVYNDPRITVSMGSLNLQGGIADFDAQLSALIPDGCAVDYAFRYVSDPNNPLVGSPATINLDILLTCNGALAPIVDLAGSRIVLSRPSAAFQHESAIFSPGFLAKTFTETVILDGFDPTVHTYGDTLEVGTGLATLTPPDTVPTPVLQPDGSYQVASVWTVPAGALTFRLRRNGARTDPTKTFRARQANWTAH